MKRPFQWNFTSLARGLGLFLSGAIIGSAVFMSIFQHNLNVVITNLRELQDSNEKLVYDNESLKKYKNRLNVISVVHVHLIPNERNPLPSDVVSELERRVKNDLKIIIGQKSSVLNNSPELYKQLISQKTYFGIHDRHVTVTVQTIVLLQTELTFWITAEPFTAPAPAQSTN
jgi:hypothetical protein